MLVNLLQHSPKLQVLRLVLLVLPSLKPNYAKLFLNHVLVLIVKRIDRRTIVTLCLVSFAGSSRVVFLNVCCIMSKPLSGEAIKE